MSIGSRLTHTVTIERPLSSGNPADDDEYGQPVRTFSTIDTVKAAIQPKTEREIALTTEAGAALSDYRIFLLPHDLMTADAIVHDASDCPMSPDLPDIRLEITGVPDAAGLGHHLEVDAHAVIPPRRVAAHVNPPASTPEQIANALQAVELIEGLNPLTVTAEQIVNALIAAGWIRAAQLTPATATPEAICLLLIASGLMYP